MYTHTVQGKVEHWFSSDKLTNDGCWYGPPDGTYFLIIPPPPPPVASLLFIHILLKMFLPVRYMEDSCIHVQHWKWRYLTSTCIPLKLTNEKWWCLQWLYRWSSLLSNLLFVILVLILPYFFADTQSLGNISLGHDSFCDVLHVHTVHNTQVHRNNVKWRCEVMLPNIPLRSQSLGFLISSVILLSGVYTQQGDCYES